MEDKLKYDKASEPQKAQKAQIWKTAIGLQAVDGLQPSEYLLDVARQHIEGDITIDEAGEYLAEYYKVRDSRDKQDNRNEEAYNDLFEKNSWYFRNALVRANYNNLQKGITADKSYLEAFFENLMYNGTNVLSNRAMHENSVTHGTKRNCFNVRKDYSQ